MLHRLDGRSTGFGLATLGLRECPRWGKEVGSSPAQRWVGAAEAWRQAASSGGIAVARRDVVVMAGGEVGSGAYVLTKAPHGLVLCSALTATWNLNPNVVHLTA